MICTPDDWKCYEKNSKGGSWSPRACLQAAGLRNRNLSRPGPWRVLLFRQAAFGLVSPEPAFRRLRRTLGAATRVRESAVPEAGAAGIPHRTF